MSDRENGTVPDSQYKVHYRYEAVAGGATIVLFVAATAIGALRPPGVTENVSPVPDRAPKPPASHIIFQAPSTPEPDGFQLLSDTIAAHPERPPTPSLSTE